MNEQRQMLADAVTRLFRDAAADLLHADPLAPPTWKAGLWTQAEELGLPLLLVPEEQGGVGGDWEDVFVALHPAAYFSVPLPLGEAMLATKLAAAAGLELPSGVLTLAADVQGALRRTADGFVFDGLLRSVPWGRDAETVVTVLPLDGQPHVVVLPRIAATLRQAQNLASEPRDELRFEGVKVAAAACEAPEAAQLFDYCALLRVAQITGALEAALHRSIEYAKERKQFGRAIGQFQAVQQQLAQFGADAAAVSCAARAACRAAAKGDAAFQIGAAKLRANMAIGLATGTAHQVHAAIGFTWEYPLRHSTQRLWSWRSEFGNDRYWSDRLGAQVAARGAENFWFDLTGRDDAASLPLAS